MWFLLLLGVLLHPGSLAQLWPPPWRGQADVLPRIPNQASWPVAQPHVPPRSRAAPRGSHAVTVTCEPHQVVVTVHRDLFGVGRLVSPADLTLGVTRCLPVSFDAVANVVVFEAGLHECGSALQMTPDLLIYRISLFYTPSRAANPVIVRTNAAKIPIECHYPRKGNLSSRAIQPTWAPFQSTVSAEAKLGFSLRLMKDDWSSERTSTHFQLGDILQLQADVHTENHLPLRVYVDSCMAGLSPETTSVAQYAIVDSHGCLVDGRHDSVSSTFFSPRPRQESLRFTVDAFRFAGDPRNMIYITCHLKVTPAEQAPDELNKACSFSAEANIWFPVEGAQGICRCCKSQNCGRTSGLQPHSFRPRPEMSWQRSLPVGTDTRQAQLVLGPLLISDAQESVDDPAEDEEIVMEEEFLPVIKPKEEVTGTRFPFKEQKGSLNVLEKEQNPKPTLPLEAYVRGGSIFLSGGEDGSGFGEQTKAPVPEESTTLEFKAEVGSRPLKGALPSSVSGKFPVEAVNLAAKGPEQPSGGMVLLSLSLLMAGSVVVLLILGALLLLRRHRHSNSALRPAALSTEL